MSRIKNSRYQRPTAEPAQPVAVVSHARSLFFPFYTGSGKLPVIMSTHAALYFSVHPKLTAEDESLYPKLKSTGVNRLSDKVHLYALLVTTITHA